MLREAGFHLPKKGWGPDRPGRLGILGGHGLDRSRHRAAGTQPEAPHRPRDPDHPDPARTRQAPGGEVDGDIEQAP
jgi:hypothetical protein